MQKSTLKRETVIPINEPLIAKNAQKYIIECLRSGWVSSAGKYIDKFEKNFSRFIGAKYGVTTTSGTTALHLALASLDIGKNDEVIIPDLTIFACALAVLYVGAKPVLAEVEKETGNIDPQKLEDKITKNTRAIMVVHLYGHPADMRRLIKIAKKHKLYVIEDAAEAHGAEILLDGKSTWTKIGSLGDIGCFSFYGNKIITTGEGGMLVTNNKKIYERANLLKDLAHSPKRRFWHEEIGYNFRMTNIQAALGLAQLEEAENYINKKRRIAYVYNQGLKDLDSLELPTEMPWAKSVYWMYAPRIKSGVTIAKNKFLQKLRNYGVDNREFFIPIHQQPALLKLGLFKKGKYPVSEDLSKRGFYIPSGLAITQKQIQYVIDVIKKILKDKTLYR